MEEVNTKPCILLAHYDQSFLQEIGGFLAQHGYNVVTKIDGAEVLAYLRDNSVDVLIMYIMLQTMYGFEVMDVIHREVLFPPQRIIYVISRHVGESTPRVILINEVPFAFWDTFEGMEKPLPDAFDWSKSGILVVTPIHLGRLRKAIEHILQLPE